MLVIFKCVGCHSCSQQCCFDFLLLWFDLVVRAAAGVMAVLAAAITSGDVGYIPILVVLFLLSVVVESNFILFLVTSFNVCKSNTIVGWSHESHYVA
jgi:hypothetical protein